MSISSTPEQVSKGSRREFLQGLGIVSLALWVPAAMIAVLNSIPPNPQKNIICRVVGRFERVIPGALNPASRFDQSVRSDPTHRFKMGNQTKLYVEIQLPGGTSTGRIEVTEKELSKIWDEVECRVIVREDGVMIPLKIIFPENKKIK